MREEKFHIYLNDDEYSRVLQSLIHLKNSLTAQGRYTDGVDDVDNKDFITQLFNAMYDELPNPKKKK